MPSILGRRRKVIFLRTKPSLPHPPATLEFFIIGSNNNIKTGRTAGDEGTEFLDRSSRCSGADGQCKQKEYKSTSLRLPGCVRLAPVGLLPSLHFITYLHELKSYPPYPLSQRLERAATPSEPRNTNGISPKTSLDFTHNKRPMTGLELAYLQ